MNRQQLLDTLQNLTNGKIVEHKIAELIGISREQFSRNKTKELEPEQLAKVENYYNELGCNINITSHKKQKVAENYDLNEIIKNICEQVINEKITPEFVESVLTRRMNNINSRTNQEFAQNPLDNK